jgi:hypothetical protein
MLYRPKTLSALVTLSLCLAGQLHSQTTSPNKVTFTPYVEVQSALKQFAADLPEGLKNKSDQELSSAWPDWVKSRDTEIRARLATGDDDSIVNFLLFGASFTSRPRITLEALSRGGRQGHQQDKLDENLLGRIDDFIVGLANPRANDRLLFARQLLAEKNGSDPRTNDGKLLIKKHLLESLARVLDEKARYAKTLTDARSGSATEEFLERSRLFKDRGLSLDTSLRPNFAIEDSLSLMKDRKLIEPGGIRRVALIGPGLDFTDKQEGYDFYPLQTIQPFAVIDSLVRLGLASGEQVTVTTLDISPRINDHIARAKKRAIGYVVQLPREDEAQWTPDFIRYWSRFGDQIGNSATALPPPANVGKVSVRAVRIRPEIAARISPVDLNVVLQRMELPESEKFDLIIATNILVYYDVFEQTIASLNIGRMLKPGRFLLSNNALVEFPFSTIRSVGYKTTVYSSKETDGDHVVWYRRSP